MDAQALAPAPEAEPAGHAAQALELAPEKVPAPQLAQADWRVMPVPDW